MLSHFRAQRLQKSEASCAVKQASVQMQTSIAIWRSHQHTITESCPAHIMTQCIGEVWPGITLVSLILNTETKNGLGTESRESRESHDKWEDNNRRKLSLKYLISRSRFLLTGREVATRMKNPKARGTKISGQGRRIHFSPESKTGRERPQSMDCDPCVIP